MREKNLSFRYSSSAKCSVLRNEEVSFVDFSAPKASRARTRSSTCFPSAAASRIHRSGTPLSPSAKPSSPRCFTGSPLFEKFKTPSSTTSRRRETKNKTQEYCRDSALFCDSNQNSSWFFSPEHIGFVLLTCPLFLSSCGCSVVQAKQKEINEASHFSVAKSIGWDSVNLKHSFVKCKKWWWKRNLYKNSLLLNQFLSSEILHHSFILWKAFCCILKAVFCRSRRFYIFDPKSVPVCAWRNVRDYKIFSLNEFSSFSPLFFLCYRFILCYFKWKKKEVWTQIFGFSLAFRMVFVFGEPFEIWPEKWSGFFFFFKKNFFACSIFSLRKREKKKKKTLDIPLIDPVCRRSRFWWDPALPSRAKNWTLFIVVTDQE